LRSFGVASVFPVVGLVVALSLLFIACSWFGLDVLSSTL
jgi:hypothetical protein